MKILISDEVSPACIEKLKTHYDVHYKTGLTQEELSSIIQDYDAWIVRSASKATASLIQAAKRLRIIGRAGAGVDNIDVEAATHNGIIVMNTPGGNTVSTAEHTVAMIMTLARNIPQASFSVKSGEWKKSKFTGTELFEKTLGILGVGKVGKEVAVRMKSFGMRIIGYDPILSADEAAKMDVELVTLDQLLMQSDFITVHTPLNKATENILNRDALSKCKNGVRIINCARGGIVDEKALLEALKSGKVAGAALDVFVSEPPVNNPLLLEANVITTPHLGASTEEAQEKVALQIAEQIIDAFEGKTIRGAVNMMPLDQSIISKSWAYLNLASRLGTLVSQAFDSPISKVQISYFGDVLDHPTELLTTTFLAGLLTGAMENVNLVNAHSLAKKNGIAVSETRSTEHKDFTHLITVNLISNGISHTVSGALYGKNDPRIVAINEFVFDTRLDGFLLKLSNEDKPGMIGKLGTLLGNHRINIAQMSLGRKGVGGDAMTLLNLDQEIAADVQGELMRSGFSEIRFINLGQPIQPINFRSSKI